MGLRTGMELSQMSEHEIMGLILVPGFSTAETVSDLSGRGVGMDVVKSNVEKIGGTIDFDSTFGSGTTFHLRLPLTLAIIPSLLVRSGEQRYAIPRFNVEELVRLFDEDALTRIETTGETELLRLRDRLLPLVRLEEVLAQPNPFSEQHRAGIVEKYQRIRKERFSQWQAVKPEARDELDFESLVVAVLRIGNDRFGLVVDQVIGSEEIVVRPMHPAVRFCTSFSGATILGDGQLALILDLDNICRHSGTPMASRMEEKRGAGTAGEGRGEAQAMLLFKAGPAEQFAVPVAILKRIERVHRSGIERIGDREFVNIDGQPTLLLRLDKLLPVSSLPDSEEVFLFLPRYSPQPFGLLISTITESVSIAVDLERKRFTRPGILGTGIVDGHLTMFLDIFRLFDLAEPGLARTNLVAERNRKKRILVVDDSSFIRTMVRTFLEGAEFQVEDAAQGQVSNPGGFPNRKVGSTMSRISVIPDSTTMFRFWGATSPGRGPTGKEFPVGPPEDGGSLSERDVITNREPVLLGKLPFGNRQTTFDGVIGGKEPSDPGIDVLANARAKSGSGSPEVIEEQRHWTFLALDDHGIEP